MDDGSPAGLEARPRPYAGSRPRDTLALRIANDMGLLDGPRTKHFNARVPPKLFLAAAQRVGSTSPAVVIEAALAALATEDELGPWLARNWGMLADVDPDLLDQAEF